MPLLVTMEVPADPESLKTALEGLCALNFRLMREAVRLGGGFPPLYRSGLVYRREPKGSEDWQSALKLMRTRRGDCEDLTCYRVGELRLLGELAMADVIPTVRGTFHAVVRREDGSIEDPSRALLALEYGLAHPR